MRNLLYCAVVVMLAASFQAEAAKGIITNIGSGGVPPKLMAFVDGTTQVYHFSGVGFGDGDFVSFEPRGASAHSLVLIQRDGYLRYAIEGTPKTPTVFFDSELGILEIKGRSIPENSIELLERYSQRPAADTTVILRMESMNVGTREALLAMLKKLESIHKAGSSKVLVYWYYQHNDEDMLKAGEALQAATGLTFKFGAISGVKRFDGIAR